MRGLYLSGGCLLFCLVFVGEWRPTELCGGGGGLGGLLGGGGGLGGLLAAYGLFTLLGLGAPRRSDGAAAPAQDPAAVSVPGQAQDALEPGTLVPKPQCERELVYPPDADRTERRAIFRSVKKCRLDLKAWAREEARAQAAAKAEAARLAKELQQQEAARKAAEEAAAAAKAKEEEMARLAALEDSADPADNALFEKECPNGGWFGSPCRKELAAYRAKIAAEN